MARKEGLDDFGSALLAITNKLRAKHGSPPLQWSTEAADKAQEWAQHLANDVGSLQHGNYEGMGQNLAYKPRGELTAEAAANTWYQEISKYNFSEPGYKENTGHFTQMVWAGTTHMGGAKATQGSSSYVVANYVPPGNVTNKGYFEKNVKEQIQ